MSMPGKTPAVVLLCFAMAAARPGDARPIHYGAVDDPSLAACDQLDWRGRRDQSADCYRALLASDAAVEIRAEAAWALNDLHGANRLFRLALESTPGDADILTRWGDLYADTHQDAEAMDIYREALAGADGHAFARLGAARVLTRSFDEAAGAWLEPLLADDSLPAGARIGAWLLVARISLENQDLAEAGKALDSADALAAASGWPPLEIYALRAAADQVGGVQPSPWIDRSLAFNPHFGDIYAVPAHFHVIARRYREAIDLYQRAVDIEPGLARAHEELGVNLLRDNQTSRARRHLEIAYERDPFSPVAVNTLRLLDSFTNFDLVSSGEGDPAAHPLVLKLHKREAPAIATYAADLAQHAIREFTQRYSYTLRKPVIIEMYPDHEDFAVRTAGMPGLGILGATFGYVIAMDSPSARSTDEFQWGTTLWHELAHVFTLEATGHLVPRWFSEGVSVLEEWRSGPQPGVHIPLSVYAAMKEDRFLPIATLDQGFLRPTYPDQVIVSYMQAGLVCRYIDERYGHAKLGEMLLAYREGLDTSEAIGRALGLDAPKFDREFQSYVETEFGAFLAGLESWRRSHAELGRLVDSGSWKRAAELADELLAEHPAYVEPDSPWLALARARDELGQPDAALAALRDYWSRGGYDPAALKDLAERLVAGAEHATAIDVLNTVALVQPLDDELHGALGDLLLEAGRPAEALREYGILLALEPHDRADAYFRLARAHSRSGNIEQSKQYLLAALDIAPGYRPAQRLLLELTRAGQDQ